MNRRRYAVEKAQQTLLKDVDVITLRISPDSCWVPFLAFQPFQALDQRVDGLFAKANTVHAFYHRLRCASRVVCHHRPARRIDLKRSHPEIFLTWKDQSP